MDAKTLKRTKNKAEKKAAVAKQKVEASIKAATNAEEALKRAMEKNSRIKGSQEAQAARIRKLEALLEESEAKAIMVEKKIVEAESSAKDRIKATAMKAVEAF